jgi:soluble lytic murein transglycosylase
MWIESIPFAETRNYVQRVLENTVVYRHRLTGQPVPITLSSDIRRGRPR